MRKALVTSSIGIHIGVAFGLFAAGVWKLERLDARERPIDLAVAPQPNDGGGSPEGSPAPEMKKKKPKQEKKVVKEPVQPTELPKKLDADTTAANTDGQGSGGGSGSGGCVEDCEPQFVPPPFFKGLRISGNEQIAAPEVVKTQILRDGKNKVVGTFRVCIGEGGEMSSLTLLKSTGYPLYDKALQDGVRTWKYKPYMLGKKPVKVCSMVTFIYGIH
jgi:outer membrane biosynthesis protein TonB